MTEEGYDMQAYVNRFEGEMLYETCEPPENLDTQYFNTDGTPTEALENIHKNTSQWASELTDKPVGMIALIGSFALGTQDDESDIDIYILIEGLSASETTSVTRGLFERTGAELASDNFGYKKTPGSLDFKIEGSPPLGRYFNMTESRWESLNLK